ncbi:tetratricopeptide repeat protein [Sinomonas sp. ASV322]|uniref:tetratricopeptide repeat protein n=1 Tax=Sinomonas sp. ASV322 TaxID=3041920 RepID=UPI0027DBC668|nr:tetratricopeptide repeat protein [Sinomonas sp. ASV322]MDQ4501139.1 tetratricopeptide repeat protein [Sinomonas sp. ASV322]
MIIEPREWPDAGFPGIAVDPETLNAVVVDEDRCHSALEASGSLEDRAVVELARGHVSEAAELIVEARYTDPESFHLKVLELDVLRLGNRNDRALERARQILAEVKGTRREATVQQYLGKIQFTRGQFAAAEDAFAKALELRVADAADASLIYSSTVALGRAREQRFGTV